MIFPHSPRGGRIAKILLIGFLFSPHLIADDSIPRGTISVDDNLVRAGARSQLNWEITYPSEKVTDLVEVKPPGTIVPKKDVTMRVRTLGVAFQSGNTLLPVQGFWSRNGGSWNRFFSGRGPDVVATKVLIETKVRKNERIDFGARAYSGRSWYPFHHTRTNDAYVTVLQDGDRAPDYAPAYNQASVESFLSPYIDGSGRIKIGPRDLIILWEGSTANPGSHYFDMQDLVVLVTFE